MRTHLTASQMAIQEMHPNAYNTSRTFGGKTKDFKTKEERNFNKAMLKAYLKGKSIFQYGFTGEFKRNPTTGWIDREVGQHKVIYQDL